MTPKEQAAIAKAVEALEADIAAQEAEDLYLSTDTRTHAYQSRDARNKAEKLKEDALSSLRALGDGWEEIATAESNGVARVLAIGQYSVPYRKAVGEGLVVAEIIYAKGLAAWFDRQGHHFIPTHGQPLPVPPGGKR